MGCTMSKSDAKDADTPTKKYPARRRPHPKAATKLTKSRLGLAVMLAAPPPEPSNPEVSVVNMNIEQYHRLEDALGESMISDAAPTDCYDEAKRHYGVLSRPKNTKPLCGAGRGASFIANANRLPSASHEQSAVRIVFSPSQQRTPGRRVAAILRARSPGIASAPRQLGRTPSHSGEWEYSMDSGDWEITLSGVLTTPNEIERQALAASS